MLLAAEGRIVSETVRVRILRKNRLSADWRL